jgi:predicted transcriptional regulator
MGGAMKKAQIEALVLALLKEKAEIRVSDVAHAAGLSKSGEGDRKAIRRVLTGLVKQGLLKACGAGRARTYVALKSAMIETTSTVVIGATPFQDILLSRESQALLKYISQSLQARIPVGYHLEFLRAYEPNETFYLTSPQRSELLKTGTAESKARPAGTYARTILNRLLIDLSWNSSRLEGNTYSLLETKRLIELGESASGKDATEAQMILNHKEAIEYIIQASDEEKISSHEVCSIHALLSENLLGDPSASGRIRQSAVGVGGTNYMPLENPQVLKECFEVFIEKLNRIEDPFEQSFFSLVQLSYMQAFEDVNKRTARIVANIPLIKKNLRPLSFMDVDREAYLKSLLGVYEKNDVSLLRDLYLWAYVRSAQRYSAIQQALGKPNLFKMKYRSDIQDIIRTVILEKVVGSKVVQKIQKMIQTKNIPGSDSKELFNVIEAEIVSLHEGNIARFKIRPSEFQAWKRLQ